MKVVIPVAGKGARLKPHTFTHPKALIPLAGKAILGHIIDKLIADGFDEFVLILGYLGDKIRDYVKQQYPELHVTYVVQHQSEGIGHALWLCSEALEGDKEVLIVLGDSVIDIDYRQFVSSHHSVLGVKKVDNPALFGVAEIDNETGFIKKLIEKPRIPKSNVALTGLYYIRQLPSLLQILDSFIREEQKSLGEFQLTDALMQLVEAGNPMVPFEVRQWFDCGQKEIVLETNAVLLKRFQPEIPTHFTDCIILPPVSIHPEAKIRHSVIGPNVSIGAHADIENCLIKESIIGEYAKLREINLAHSLIGNDSAVTGSVQSLNIGDSTEIQLGS